MNCVICNAILQEGNIQVDIFYTATTHSNTLLINFIKKLLNWDLSECNLRYLCQLCYNLLQELDIAEVTCSNIKKQLKDRGEIHKYNVYFKDNCTQTCDEENLDILSSTLIDTIKSETNLDFEPVNENESEKDVNIEPEKIKNKYDCIYCAKKCSSKAGLSLHVRKKHAKENQEIKESIQNLPEVENRTENLEPIKLETEFEDPDDNFSSEPIPDLSDSNSNEPLAESNNEDKSLKKTKLKKQKQEKLPFIKPLIYPCPQCPKMWRTLGELKNHIATHSDVRPYVCEICGQAYKQKKALDIHIAMHNGINQFCCEFCNKAFTQKGALRRHMPIHTGEAPYQCDLCGKRFVHHTSFNMHTLAHTGQKSYKCDICGLCLLSGSHLKRHMRVHTGERPYACTQCGKRFAERYNLAAHQKLHEAGPSEQSKQRLFRCQICESGFDRRTKLEEHLSNSHNKIGDNDSERNWLSQFVAT